MSKKEVFSKPKNARELIIEVGKLLLRKHGMKGKYSVKAIHLACRKSNYRNQLELHHTAWVTSVFADEKTFVSHYDTTNLNVYYGPMRKAMLKGISYEKLMAIIQKGPKPKFDFNTTSVGNLTLSLIHI